MKEVHMLYIDGKVEVDVYYYIDDNGHKVYDVDNMREEFEKKLKKLQSKKHKKQPTFHQTFMKKHK